MLANWQLIPVINNPLNFQRVTRLPVVTVAPGNSVVKYENRALDGSPKPCVDNYFKNRQKPT